jgi:hypothetical protein
MQGALAQAIDLEGQGRLFEADLVYQNILQIDGKNGLAMYRRAVLASQRNEHDKAVQLVQSALKHVPKKVRDQAKIDFGKIMRRYGEFALEQGRIEEAHESFTQAVSFNPADQHSQFSEALSLLMHGDYVNGWRKYKWRWKAVEASAEQMGVARSEWTGAQPLEGKSVYVTPEQGFGDTIMFVRYAPLLAQRGAKVTVAVHPPLRAIIGTLKGVDVGQNGDQIKRPDYQCSMLDLPGAFKTEVSSIPADIPYLRTIASYDDKWRGAVPREKRLRVGLVWSGGLAFGGDKKRSMKFADFTPLFDSADIQFVSLQREVRDYDAPALAARLDVLHFGERLQDFADTASVIAQLDVVISVDTSVAHLAGALGKPLWVMLPYVPDFRWMLNRTDSPWYPTATLFRQESLGDWPGVIARLKAALETFVPAPAP